MLNEYILNKIIRKTINEAISEIDKGGIMGSINLFKAQELEPESDDKAKTVRLVPKKVAKDALWQKRKQSKDEIEQIKFKEYMDKKVQSALSTNGIMFPKGMEITNGKKIKYSVEAETFMTYVKKMYPEYELKKSFTKQKRKERGQLDDVVYYDMFIKLIK